MKTLILGTLLFSNMVFGSVSIFRTVMIYNELVTKNNIKNPPKLAVNRDLNAVPNAYYSREHNVIVINKTLLQEYDEDTVATTLGHELGHAKHKHTISPLMRSSVCRAQEKRADLDGQIITERAGYNSCKGFKWIADMNIKNDPEHPDSAERNRYLGCTNRRMR